MTITPPIIAVLQPKLQIIICNCILSCVAVYKFKGNFSLTTRQKCRPTFLRGKIIIFRINNMTVRHS